MEKERRSMKQTCNHCGQCCLSISCQLSQVLFKVTEDTYCPALEIQDGYYYCGLIQNTAKYVSELVGQEEWKPSYLSQMFKNWLGVGLGCDSDKASEEA